MRPRFYRAITSRSPEDWDLPFESTLLCFQRFPDLPLELRQMVYSYTLPEPRIIQFGSDHAAYSLPSTELQTIQLGTLRDECAEYDRNPSTTVINTSNVHNGDEDVIKSEVDVTTPKASDRATKLPWALLAVNKETRDWAKKTYRLSFQTGFAGGNGCIYVDFSRDTLSFHNAYSLKLFCQLIHFSSSSSDLPNKSHGLLDEVTILPRKIAVMENLGDLNHKHLAQLENLQILNVLTSSPRSWRWDYSVLEKWHKMVLKRNRSSPGKDSGNQKASEREGASQDEKKSARTSERAEGSKDAKASSITVASLPKVCHYKLRGYRDRFWPLF